MGGSPRALSDRSMMERPSFSGKMQPRKFGAMDRQDFMDTNSLSGCGNGLKFGISEKGGVMP